MKLNFTGIISCTTNRTNQTLQKKL